MKSKTAGQFFLPYIGGYIKYREKLAQVAQNGYQGFHIKKTVRNFYLIRT